jgi:uncharacterized protein (DUF1697 family)
MTTFVVMLRGINVSGRNRLAMDDLRGIIADSGGTDVQTYIQSGNAVFLSDRPSSAVVTSLETGLRDLLGNRVPVLVRTKEELARVIAVNPFLPRHDPKILHVTFMAAEPDPAAVASVGTTKTDVDQLQVIGREVYLLCPDGYGKTKLTNTFFERRLGSGATTRNWKTITTLGRMTQA